MKTTAKQPAKHGRRYPWGDWFAKGPSVLRKGRHYDCASYAFAVMVRRQASAHGYSIVTKVADDSVTIVSLTSKG